jgi:rhamnulokinase
MTAEKSFAAIDLGAESGRVMLAKLSSDNIHLEEVHRFSNGPVKLINGLHWDVLKLFDEIKKGLSYCQSKVNSIDGIGLDTWGVDFGLLDADDRLIYNPFHYRDPRTDGMLEKTFSMVPREEIFERTGIQFMQINSLYQLMAMKETPILDSARTFLTIPDLLNFWLTGSKVCEFTNATTTQIFDQRENAWAYGILEALGLPTKIFPEVIQPGTILGNLAKYILLETGLGEEIPVIAPACHDTGSAVAAVPATQSGFAYISSGTWSLVGVETPSPVINSKSLAYNFTNEGGVGGKVRLLKNVTGLWLVQECRRHWAAEGESYTYGELAQLAQNAPAFGPVLDPDAGCFLHPSDMPAEIMNYCKVSGQEAPQSKAAILRCIFESLSLKYRYVIEILEELTKETLDVIHIIGGGSQNEFLNQLTADVTGKPVIAGPVEATALGNAMVQAVATGFIDSIQECRHLISEQSNLKRFEPGNGKGRWDEAYSRFAQLIDRELV